MLAMQLNLRLGACSDETGAYGRVVDCARRVSPRRDLVHAACLVDDEAHVCAPLYIWRSGGAMRCFLLGSRFGEVVDGFGRPRVRTWSVLEFDPGDTSVAPRFAISEIDALDPERNLRSVAQREKRRHREMLRRPGLYSHAAAVDPDRWEIVRFSLWRDELCAAPADADCVHTYRVTQHTEPILVDD